jgi:hypothetical protein
MNSQEILGIIELVVPQKLKVSRAEEVFGPAERRSPMQLKLEPRDRRFEYVILETPAAAPDIVVSVMIRLAQPSPCDLGFFEKVFGKPSIIPRLKPDQPIPYSFDLMYKGGHGQLLLGMKEDLLVTLRVDRFD